MAEKLNIAFLWHMHQPYYRDPTSGKYILPWVRLHGLKGYTDMLEAVRRFGSVQVTFNFVPCLVKQLCDLTSGEESDLYSDLSQKPAEDLSPVEKKIILQHFFSAHWENMVLRYPRYRDLLYQRGRRILDSEADHIIKSFTSRDFRDLQVWFNLTWFGWAAQERYPQISELKRKDRDFTEEEKIQLLDLQKEVLSQIIPAYASLWKESQIEISTSPYYHPILPLIVDSRIARISQPQDPMPGRVFQHPEDAREQLQQGRNFIAEQFGQKPVGLWPSEGSVSPAVCELAGESGFEWLATDENLLLVTLSNAKREEVIYQTYSAYEGGPTLVFRDRSLSDAIGFRYARNAPERAVDDFLGHLENIASSVPSPETSMVAVILDGENAWEYFSDGGRDFFKELYDRLSQHPHLRTRTIGDFVRQNPAKSVLPPIFPASWIRGSFRIWIGDPVKNAAWDNLAETASVLEEISKNGNNGEAAERARRWLHIAEGSDWFWWYGEPNKSDFDDEFDQLFRSNLMQVYNEFGLEIPGSLLRPLRGDEAGEEVPLFPMKPKLDGRETNFYEWVGARVIKASDFSGSMNFESGLLEKLYFGLSETDLFFRLDPTEQFRSITDLKIIIQFTGTDQPLLEIQKFRSGTKPEALWRCGDSVTRLSDVAFDHILELALPFDVLPGAHDEVLFNIILKKGDLEIERWPREGSYVCPWPTEEYLTANWVV